MVNKDYSLISVVIPIYNERDNLDKLTSELLEALEVVGKPWEIILVDDGSEDGTWELLNEKYGDWDGGRIKLVRLARNYGQTIALKAGIDISSGDVIVTLDGDLQNEPSDIPLLLSEIEKGADVVSGWRRNRKDALITRKIPSWLGNKLVSWQTGVKLHDYGCGLKAYRGEFIKSVKLYGEMHRLVPALLDWMGASIVEVEVSHRARKAGKSKYNLSRVFALILDIISLKFFSSYATRPTHVMGMWGIISIFLGFLSFVTLVVMKLVMDFNMTGNPFFILWVLLTIVGIQLIALGLLGEINVRAYFEIQDKAPYRVMEIKGE